MIAYFMNVLLSAGDYHTRLGKQTANGTPMSSLGKLFHSSVASFQQRMAGDEAELEKPRGSAETAELAVIDMLASVVHRARWVLLGHASLRVRIHPRLFPCCRRWLYIL
jgi:hypothetical protein